MEVIRFEVPILKRTGIMKKLVTGLLLLVISFFAWSGIALGYENKALILVDELPAAGSPDPGSQDVLANLLGHFDLPYEIRVVNDYTQGDVDRYRVTFYVGDTYDHALPLVFLNDVMETNSPVVWINYNLWMLAWSDYQQQFEARFGFSFTGASASAAYNKVSFNGRTLSRSQSDFEKIAILDAAKAQVSSRITNGTASFPHITRSGNFWFVADDPMSQNEEGSAYLAFSEELHDMVGIQHAVSHRAMVRIEDVDPTEDPAKIRAIADYLSSQNVPFSLAVIPRFTDPLGAWGPVMTLDLDQSPDLVSALSYAQSKGGTLIMHGYTHQYGAVANPTNGVTGVDCEFYIQQADSGGNIIVASPVPEDSTAWAQGRIDGSATIFNRAGFPRPFIWETPHYLASNLDEQVFSDSFGVVYERFANAYFPYTINRTVYGSRLIPENLGYIEPGVISAQTIINRADKNLVVSDGIASFFFHSEVNISYLKTAVSGIKAKGYTFVGADMVGDGIAPVVTYTGPAGLRAPGGATVTATATDSGLTSGIDPAGASLSIDGGAATPCSITAGAVSCPASGLGDGSHGAVVTVSDLAGNAGTGAGTIDVDGTPPAITNLTPAGSIFEATATIGADYADSGAGIDTATVNVYLDGAPVSGCSVSAASVSCPVSGLGIGVHAVSVSAADLFGNAATVAGAFERSLCSEPLLRLATTGSYWMSFSDYLGRVLSVEYVITNESAYPVEVHIEGAMSSNGANFLASPADIYPVAVGSTATTTLTFRVSEGVSSFRTSLFATVTDVCGNTYSYPGPYPGA